MRELFGSRRTRQAIANFLKKAKWDAPEVLQQQALKLLKSLGCRAGDTVHILLDDTQNRKRGKVMAALSKIFLHAEKVYAKGHILVGCALVFRGVLIPYRISLWANEEFCEQSQKAEDPDDQVKFQKLTELAANAVRAVALPKGVRGIALFDSYYLCPPKILLVNERAKTWVFATLERPKRTAISIPMVVLATSGN